MGADPPIRLEYLRSMLPPVCEEKSDLLCRPVLLWITPSKGEDVYGTEAPCGRQCEELGVFP